MDIINNSNYLKTAQELLKELHEENQRPLTEENRQEIAEMAETLGLKITSAMLQHWKFSAVKILKNQLEQNKNCERCIFQMTARNENRVDLCQCRNNHKRNILKIENGNLITDLVDCEDFIKIRKLHILELAKIPLIFRNVNAKTDFKITAGNAEALKFANESVINNGGAYFWGKPGAGKTMLASIIAIERAKRNKYTTFLTITDLFYLLNPYNYEDGKKFQISEQRHKIQNAKCLIVDDIGVEKPSKWTLQTLFDIVNFRYSNNLQTIFTSNFSPEQLNRRFEGYEGERIIRRIQAIATPVFMEFNPSN